MSKIDTSTIEGFGEMTAEQQVQALLGLEVPDKVDLSGYVPKAEADGAKAKAAELQKQLTAKMTDEEAEAAAKAQELAEMQAKLAEQEQALQTLRQERTEATYKAKYLALPGFDEKLAGETARNMAAGDMDKVFANLQKASEAHAKQLRAELMKQTPQPRGGQDGQGGEPEAVQIARELGKARGAVQAGPADVLKHYL